MLPFQNLSAKSISPSCSHNPEWPYSNFLSKVILARSFFPDFTASLYSFLLSSTGMVASSSGCKIITGHLI